MSFRCKYHLPPCDRNKKNEDGCCSISKDYYKMMNSCEQQSLRMNPCKDFEGATHRFKLTPGRHDDFAHCEINTTSDSAVHELCVNRCVSNVIHAEGSISAHERNLCKNETCCGKDMTWKEGSCQKN